MQKYNRILAVKGSRPEKDFLESYRKLLFGQFDAMALLTPANNPAALAEAQAVRQIPADDIVWEDLYCLELAIVALESDEELRRHAWSLRSEYKEVASSEEWKDYIESVPPELKPLPVTAPMPSADPLRNDLSRVQKEVHWRYTILWAYEDYRSHVTVWVWLWGITALLILAGAAYFLQDLGCAKWDLNIPLLALLAGLGVVGGLTSTMRRIQKFEWGGNADVEISKLGAGNITVFLSPLLGGLFSVLLFFMFASGLVNGDLFPSVTFEHILCNCAADLNGSDYAKLIVWAFAAGFAEQFVPDNLARIVGEK